MLVRHQEFIKYKTYPSECITRNAEMVHTRIQLASRRVADAGRVEQCRRPYARGRTEGDRNQRRYQGTELLPALEQRLDSEVRRGLHISARPSAQGTSTGSPLRCR